MVVGLPGSGKTELAKQIAQSTGRQLIDDPTDMDFLEKSDGNIVIADPFFCETHIRELALQVLAESFPDAELEVIFFENNPIQAKINARKRGTRKVDGLINHLSSIYQPEDETLPVWNG